MTSKNYSFAFQPIVDTRLQRVSSYEALVRGNNNESAWSVIKPLSGLALWEFDRDARTHAVKLAASLGIDCLLNLNLLPESLNALGGNVMFSTIDMAIASGLRPRANCTGSQ